MTADASRSCLGLGTCVGSSIRQIVDARVILTATAPPALPGRACQIVRGRLPRMRSRDATAHSAAGGTCWAIAHTKPASSRAIASGDDIGRLAGPDEPAIARAQPHLPLPGDVADRLWLPLLSQQQLPADPGREAVTPGRFDQQPTGRAIAGLGEARI